MISPRLSNERGHADHGWLSRATASPSPTIRSGRDGMGMLRVINEDSIAAAAASACTQRDMEIVTYILYGSLEHGDSLGNGGVIRRGEVQRMSAGRGIMHSEFNPSPEPVRTCCRYGSSRRNAARAPATSSSRCPRPNCAAAGAWSPRRRCRRQHDHRPGRAPVGDAAGARRSAGLRPGARTSRPTPMSSAVNLP